MNELKSHGGHGGPHIGAPARPPPASISERRTRDDERSRVARGGGSRDGEWLARRWSGVQLRAAELLSREGDGVRRPTLRAIVQLGTLTPADVRVIAGPAAQSVGNAAVERLRLMSVRSHHNGAVVFEAAAAPGDAGARDFVVTVRPAPRLLRGGPLPSVVGHVIETARTHGEP